MIDENKWVCPSCKLSFYTEYTLLKHMKKEHPILGDKWK